MKTKRYQLEIVEDLNKAALEAHKAGHFLEAAIINFQRIEVLLRLAITVYARALGVIGSAVNSIDEEQSFHNLVVFFSLLRPKDRLSEKLFGLNRKRNSFVHKIFIDFKSVESVKDELKRFSVEAVEVTRSLSKLLEPYMEKKGSKTD